MPRTTDPTLSLEAAKHFLNNVVKCANEAEIRVTIQEWYSKWTESSDHVLLEYPVPNGAIDILVASYKLVIETKKRDTVGPERQQGQETQIQKLSRYLEQMEQERPFQNEDIPWLGILTDGLSWYVYEWDRIKKQAVPIDLWQEFKIENNDSGAAHLIHFHERYLSPEKRHAGKPPPPETFTQNIIMPEIHTFDRILDDAEGRDTFPTKFGLWKSILAGSGILPSAVYTRKIARLFRDHCLVVCTTRAIRQAINGSDVDLKQMTNGYPSWIAESTEGCDWLERLFKNISQYDWQATQTDVLRKVYEELIPRADRHDFGAYYTPDWLAEYICLRVLDDHWITQSLEAAYHSLTDPNTRRIVQHGVLDPSCGSGTFLFHAARRITRVAKEKHQLNAEECATITARLVHGLDIHPVAAEMSQATLLSALPTIPYGGDSALLVHQGDALLLKYQEHTLKAHGAIPVTTSQNNHFEIPEVLLNSDHFESVIADTVECATKDIKDTDHEDEPPDFRATSWQTSFSPYAMQHIIDFTKQLRAVYRKEGNSIWTWYLHNLAHPLILHRHKVDRIIGNPPWISSAVDPKTDIHAETINRMTKALGLSKGGIGQGASESNLAKFFVIRTRDLYLSSDHGRCGLVLPYSSLRSSGWKQFADPNKFSFWTEQHDLLRMKEPPFPKSAHASIWFALKHHPQSKSGQHASPQRVIWEMIPDAEPTKATHSWEAVASKITFRYPDTYSVSQPSVYDNRFRKGANMNPTRFVIVTIEQDHGDGTVTIRGHTSQRQKWPWSTMPVVHGPVESSALLPALIPASVLPFRVTEDRFFLLGPFRKTDKDTDSLLEETSGFTLAHTVHEWLAIGTQFTSLWQGLDQHYRRYRHRTLSELLDFGGNLTPQLRAIHDDGAKHIVYNKSGTHLCATRLHHQNCLVNDGLYHYTAQSVAEAHYLLGILNAQTLQQAYRHARLTDRGYDKHIWKAVPVPDFDPQQLAHTKIVRLAESCEQFIDSLVPVPSRKQAREMLADSTQMITLNNTVREIVQLQPYCDWK